ncbi:MAG: S24 family peptidase [Burkholderiaceae bacterium]|nr:S24 family peptidase [Burkholderiaceae bacterium]
MVPVISWVQAGTWQDAADPGQPGLAEEWMPSPVRCSAGSFVLRVRGASMEPKFHDGEMIIVDPEAEARNKSFVVVRLDDSKEATFKQLIIEGDHRYLKPLNPQWPDPIIEINGNATICGVVVFKGEKI